MISKFSSLIELMETLNTESKCLQQLMISRWDGIPVCPHCEGENVYCFADNIRFSCMACKKQFTAKVGTIFESSKVPLRKWAIAMYLLFSHKNGISSHQVGRDIKVTQKTAWYMLQRIRSGMNTLDPNMLAGEIQIDETFVGGKNKNRHANKKVKNSGGRSFADKTPVVGMVQDEVVKVEYRENKINPTMPLVKVKTIETPAKVRAVVVKATQAQYVIPVVFEIRICNAGR